MINCYATKNHFHSLQKYKQMTTKKLYSATIFFTENRLRPRKYRNINNKEKFAKFAKNSQAIYINWYDQKTKIFENRQWLHNFD